MKCNGCCKVVNSGVCRTCNPRMVVCEVCGESREITRSHYWAITKGLESSTCRKCFSKDPDWRINQKAGCNTLDNRLSNLVQALKQTKRGNIAELHRAAMKVVKKYNKRIDRENRLEESKEARREKARKWFQYSYRTNIQHKLAVSLRNRLRHVLCGKYKSGSAVRDLGCSIESFKLYIESKWKPGMSWDNYGKDGWHLDHIVPLKSFDLTNREELLVACHYTNYQPLWATENLTKNATTEPYNHFFLFKPRGQSYV